MRPDDCAGARSAWSAPAIGTASPCLNRREWPSGPRRTGGWARATDRDQAEGDRLHDVIAAGHRTVGVDKLGAFGHGEQVHPTERAQRKRPATSDVVAPEHDMEIAHLELKHSAYT
jgi:hypothetical protein